MGNYTAMSNQDAQQKASALGVKEGLFIKAEGMNKAMKVQDIFIDDLQFSQNKAIVVKLVDKFRPWRDFCFMTLDFLYNTAYLIESDGEEVLFKYSSSQLFIV